MKKIIVDGETFIAEKYINRQPAADTDRYAVVVDRGWIFAGDLELIEKHGIKYLRLTRVVWLFRWEQIGFDGVLDNPFNEHFERREMLHRTIELPTPASEIFRVPVCKNWGIDGMDDNGKE